MQEKIQHALLTTGFRQVEVLQLVDQQGADEKRAGHLLHLLQRIIDVSMPVALVVVLIS